MKTKQELIKLGLETRKSILNTRISVLMSDLAGFSLTVDNQMQYIELHNSIEELLNINMELEELSDV